MTESENFAQRIRERFPEGLTGVFAVGGTRTGFILENHQDGAEPGAIPDFLQYARTTLARYFQLIQDFIELGGQNMVIALLAYQRFSAQGDKYARAVSELCLWLTNDESIAFYKQHRISPYFVGIDTLLQLPEGHYARELATKLAEFHASWNYNETDRKIIWEIAPMQLFSFWHAQEALDPQARAAFNAELAACDDLQATQDLLYKFYARAAYGTDLPTPHFYIGTNRKGSLKVRSVLPIALLCGGPFRMFYTPYPSLFMTKATLKAIIEDIAFDATISSNKMDYTDQVSSEMLEAEYQRVIALSSDPDSTVGLTRLMGNEGR